MLEQKGGKNLLVFTLVVFLIIIGGAVYYYYFYSPKCSDLTCFKEALWACKRAGFISESQEATWDYQIKGRSSDVCIVTARAISISADVGTGTAMQGNEMECAIPTEVLGSFMPEEKIEYCHGLLKEKIQEVMIEKMHLYIVKNIGQVNKTTSL